MSGIPEWPVPLNSCIAIFSGLTPIIAMTLIQKTEALNSPAIYLMFCGVLGIVGVYLVKARLSDRPS
ncbi:MAG: hypothetical protein ACPG5T_04725 [Endozoicomonas sp.]